MQYVTVELCKELVFPYIYEQLSDVEPSDVYEANSSGIGELEKVLQFVRQDNFYPTFYDKAAYILCSIAGSQYFTNGNKRLGVVTLMMFFIINDIEVRVLQIDDYRHLLEIFFPKHLWENNTNITESDPLFLYNLAIAIGSPECWEDNDDFTTVKKKVSEMFSNVYRLPNGNK